MSVTKTLRKFAVIILEAEPTSVWHHQQRASGLGWYFLRGLFPFSQALLHTHLLAPSIAAKTFVITAQHQNFQAAISIVFPLKPTGNAGARKGLGYLQPRWPPAPAEEEPARGGTAACPEAPGVWERRSRLPPGSALSGAERASERRCPPASPLAGELKQAQLAESL